MGGAGVGAIGGAIKAAPKIVSGVVGENVWKTKIPESGGGSFKSPVTAQNLADLDKFSLKPLQLKSGNAIDVPPSGFSAEPMVNAQGQRLLSATPKPLMLGEGKIPLPPAKPVGLGEAPKGKFAIKNSTESNYSKLSSKQVNQLETEIKAEITKLEDAQYQLLKKQSTKGVDTMLKDVRGNSKNNNDYSRVTVSNNDLWYSKAYAEKGATPANYDLRNIAKKQLSEGYADRLGDIPADEYYNSLKQKLDDISIHKQTNPSGKISDLSPEKKLQPKIQQYNQQMNQISKGNKIEPNFKKETPYKAYPAEVTNVTTPPKVQSQFAKETFAQPKKPIPMKQNVPLNVVKVQKDIQAPSTKTEPLNGKINANSKVEYSEPITPPTVVKNATVEPNIKSGKEKTRQFPDNSLQQSEIIPEEMKLNYKRNPLKYDEITNQKTIDEAYKIVDKDYAGNVRDFLTKESLDDALDTGKGIALIERAIQKGNIKDADDLVVSLAKKLTKTGQATQAASIMAKLTPSGMLKQANKVLEEFNKSNPKRIDIRFNEGESKSIVDIMQNVVSAENGTLKLFKINLQKFAEKNKPLAEKLKSLAREDGTIDFSKDALALKQFTEQSIDDVAFITASKLPATKFEKFNSLRRMAMLANPKTHIKNTVGNTIMMAARKTADTIGAGLEKMVLKEGERTKSFGWSKDKDIVDVVNRDWEWHKNALKKGGKWEFDTVFLNQEKPIFDKGRLTKFVERKTGKQFDKGFLEMANELSKNALNASDNVFLQRAYKDALGGYLKANGLKAVNVEARLYATRRAYEAVFKQANTFSNWITKMKSKGGPIGTFLEAKMPFTKTPSNIVLRGVEYSPAGLIKALYSAKTGKTAADVIEDLAKGITGTGLYGVGVGLAALGWAQISGTKSKSLQNIQSDAGEQPYSIDTPLGTYTFDWAQPSSIPVAMGIATMESLSKKSKGEDDIGIYDVAMKSLAAGGDTLFNTTMLRNVTDMFGGKYGSPTEALLDAPSEYVQQALPSLMGQLTRSIDTTKRDTSGGFIDLAKSKVPFLSKTLPAKVDVYGREQKQPGMFQQFIGPGTLKTDSNDPTSKELIRLSKATERTDFLPQFATSKITYQLEKKGESQKKLLNAQEKESYAKALGQAYKSELDKIISSSTYGNLKTDKDKASNINTALNKIKEKVDNEFLKQQGIREYKALAKPTKPSLPKRRAVN
jgi:hypothetical protein